MRRELILGTAGHIDHGKTALVKALTGVDCDRLPEEKARGITIDIGFAHLDLDNYRLGIVDVPGHERFIRNMLAGATGIDLVMLVIAADDSIMPQTREHLEILELLGLRHGLVVITKADLVDDATRGVVEMEAAQLVAGTFLAKAPVVATSAVTGLGLDELKRYLAELCRQVEDQRDESWFRLAIDRAFVVQGHGTVVTGSVTSGQLRIGDDLEWLPRGERVRVRSLQSHDESVEVVRRGMRAAINLAGIRLEDVHRGQELATPGWLVPSRVLTVKLHALKDATRPLKHRAPVRFHIGTAEIMGTVSLLDADEVAPGATALAQVFLDEPAVAVFGQAFVIRGPSATYTLGGGQVLQPHPPKIRRRHEEVLRHVVDLAEGEPATRAAAAAWFRGFAGVTAADLVRDAGTAPSQAAALLTDLRQQGTLHAIATGTVPRLVYGARLREVSDRVVKVLHQFHDRFPLLSTIDRPKIVAQFDYLGDDALVNGVIDQLLHAGTLMGDARRVALAVHKPRLSANQRKLKERIVAAFREAKFQPPDPASFVPFAAGLAQSLQDLFDVCVAEGELVAIGPHLYLHADHEATLRKLVAQRLADGRAATVSELRELLGTTRKFAVPMCEYLDRIGFTRREGDLRTLAAASESLRVPS